LADRKPPGLGDGTDHEQPRFQHITRVGARADKRKAQGRIGKDAMIPVASGGNVARRLVEPEGLDVRRHFRRGKELDVTAKSMSGLEVRHHGTLIP
jgi:hypothetical protein